MMDIIISALDKDLESFEVQELLNYFNKEPHIEYPDPECQFSEEHGVEYHFYEDGALAMFDQENKLISVRLFYLAEEKFNSFSNQILLPFIIKGDKTSKDDIIQELGPPSKENKKGKSILGGEIPNWMSYDYNDFRLHFSFFSELKTLKRVNFISPRAV